MTASAAPASQTPEELFAAVCDHARRVAVLASVEALLGWDEQTSLPPEAGSYRGEQAAAVAGIVHRLRTDPAHGDRIAQLAAGPLAHSGPAVVAGTIRLLERDFTKQARLPARLVEELAKTSIEAQQAWRPAREASSWEAFAPWLERMFALKREQAACQLPDHDPYDALMDDYEPGASWSAIAARFDRLRSQIVPLVRACVDAGDVVAATEALGRPHRVEGVVVRGDGRGKGLGYPTANVAPPMHSAIPADGVYAAWFTVLGHGPGTGSVVPGERYLAAVSVGTNPTFSGRTRTVEAFVLDTDADLYGQHVAVGFVARIRGQKKFASVDDLIEAMGRDTGKARSILAAQS
jgi:hypothetical protein